MKLLLATLLAQAAVSAGDEPAPEAGPWLPIDGVAAQAGDKILTIGGLSSLLESQLGERTVSTQEELDHEFTQALEASVTKMLEAQAGEDMGLDPERLGRYLTLDERDRRQSLGASGFAEYLEGRGVDGLRATQEKSQELTIYVWRNSVTGNRTVLGDRPYRDTYVRPGELKAIYRQNRSDLGVPDQVRFRVFEMLAAAAGGPGEAKRICGEARERVLAGEDLEDVMIEFGVLPRETRGLTPPLVVQEITDERLRSFAGAAATGDLSEVVPFEPPPGARGGGGYLFVELFARREGTPPPPFSDPRVQEFLRLEYQRKQHEALLGQARGKLRRESYLWLNPRFRGERSEPAAAGAPAPGPATPAPSGQATGPIDGAETAPPPR